MRNDPDRFEDFHTGLRAGHDAGQTRNLLYLAGFLIGFAWGALAGPGREQLKAVPREATR